MLSSSYWKFISSIAVGVSAKSVAPIGEGALRHLHWLGNKVCLPIALFPPTFLQDSTTIQPRIYHDTCSTWVVLLHPAL
jgi:hypothetical protein